MLKRKDAKTLRRRDFFPSLRLCALALLVLFLAAVVRFHLLGSQSFWNDEGNSYVQATRALTEIPLHAARDIHPPGYYWLLHLWRLLTGDSEFALRALSAFASLLTVALTVALGRRLYGTVAGIAAGLFVALNTFQVYFAQEARMYALLALWGAAGMTALVGFVTSPPAPLHIWRGEKTRWALALALINAAGLWTQYAYPFVMLAQGVVFVVWWGERVAKALTLNPSPSGRGTSDAALFPFVLRGLLERVPRMSHLTPRPPLRNREGEQNGSQRFFKSPLQRGEGIRGEVSELARNALRGTEGVDSDSTEGNFAAEGRPNKTFFLYLLANLLTILLYLPWLPMALHSVTAWPSTGHPVALSEALGLIVGWFTLGITAHVLDASWAAVGLLLLLFGLRVTHPVRALWRLMLPVAWAVVPVGMFLALGLFREGNLKLLLPAQVGFALWMGRGAGMLWHLDMPGQTRHRRIGLLPRAAALIGVLGLAVNLGRGLEPLYHQPDFQRDDYRGIVTALDAVLRPGDAIILDAPNQAEVFRYYYDGAAPVYLLPPGLGGDDAETRAAVEEIIDGYARAFVVYWGEAERDPQRVVETTLNTRAFEAASQWYGDVRLVRYVMPVEPQIERTSGAQFGDAIRLEGYALSSDSVAPGDALQIRLDWVTEAPLDQRYKVFVQLLDEAGQLVAQHDGEPGGGQALTPTWLPGVTVSDQHALIIPDDLSPAHYTLILGLYAVDNAQQRLRVGDSDHLTLSEIRVQ